MPKPHQLRRAARKFLDAEDPLAALTDAGVDTTDGGDVRELILPSDSRVRVSFQAEGTSHRMMKLFTGELQVGDSGFDDAVFITTDTKDATTKLLDADAFRGAILQVIKRKGHVRINGVDVVIAGGNAQLNATITAYVLAYAECTT